MFFEYFFSLSARFCVGVFFAKSRKWRLGEVTASFSLVKMHRVLDTWLFGGISWTNDASAIKTKRWQKLMEIIEEKLQPYLENKDIE